jgi:hypothetical protein
MLKTKIATSILILLMASITLLAENQVQAQNVTYTNMQDSGSLQLPLNSTPDETYETISHLSFRPAPRRSWSTIAC